MIKKIKCLNCNVYFKKLCGTQKFCSSKCRVSYNNLKNNKNMVDTIYKEYLDLNKQIKELEYKKKTIIENYDIINCKLGNHNYVFKIFLDDNSITSTSNINYSRFNKCIKIKGNHIKKIIKVCTVCGLEIDVLDARSYIIKT